MNYTAWKVSKYGVFSGPYFPVIGLNTEIYVVNLYIQSEYRKIRTRKNSAFGHFSRSAKIFTFKSVWIAMTGLNLSTGACKKISKFRKVSGFQLRVSVMVKYWLPFTWTHKVHFSRIFRSFLNSFFFKHCQLWTFFFTCLNALAIELHVSKTNMN